MPPISDISLSSSFLTESLPLPRNDRMSSISSSFSNYYSDKGYKSGYLKVELFFLFCKRVNQEESESAYIEPVQNEINYAE